MKEAFINSITMIKNKTTNEIINLNKIKCNLFTNKYSAKKNSIWCLFVNDIQITKKTNYIFQYKCLTCNSIHNVATTQILRRLNKDTERCYLCRNSDTEKKQQQSLFMSSNNPQKPLDKEPVKQTFVDIKNTFINKFNQYDDDFKENYFKSHLTDTEYTRISKNIKSFGNGVYNDIFNYEYWAIYKSANQMLFTDIMYDKINNTIFKPNQPIIKCDNCGNDWRASSIHTFKNDIKIMCKDCSLTNKVFKIRHTKNNMNETILYQSKLELKFITWCNNNNITVHNGPKVGYQFNIKREYRVDFKINNTLIEIKDNHIWHQNDVKSGKFLAKCNAINELIKNNIYDNFYVINPSNWNNMLNKLIKYSLTSYESMRSDSLNTLT